MQFCAGNCVPWATLTQHNFHVCPCRGVGGNEHPRASGQASTAPAAGGTGSGPAPAQPVTHKPGATSPPARGCGQRCVATAAAGVADRRGQHLQPRQEAACSSRCWPPCWHSRRGHQCSRPRQGGCSACNVKPNCRGEDSSRRRRVRFSHTEPWVMSVLLAPETKERHAQGSWRGGCHGSLQGCLSTYTLWCVATGFIAV